MPKKERYNRASLLASYKERFRLSGVSTCFLDGFFRSRRIPSDLTKEETLMLIDIYRMTDHVFAEADKKIQMQNRERMAL
jgi:hypothetical protein